MIIPSVGYFFVVTLVIIIVKAVVGPVSEMPVFFTSYFRKLRWIQGLDAQRPHQNISHIV